MRVVKFIDFFILTCNLVCLYESLLESALFFWKYFDCRMLSMVIFVNLYFFLYLVSVNMRIHDDNYSYDCCSIDFNFWAGASIANVMGSTVLWHNISYGWVHCMVSLVVFSIFKMGKLTQSQKALFLWRSPLAKMQWVISWYWFLTLFSTINKYHTIWLALIILFFEYNIINHNISTAFAETSIIDE